MISKAWTALGCGILFFLIDPHAKVAVTMLSRPFADGEWEQYRRSQAGERRRRPGESVDDDPFVLHGVSRRDLQLEDP